MYLRPYNKAKDFQYISQWVTDARTHALWCANRIPYPIAENAFHELLAQNEKDWGDCGYVFMKDITARQPIGFCAFSVNETDNSGFLKFIVINSSGRGKGLGTQMLQTFLKYAFEIVGVDEVKLNVFDVNIAAKRCYEKAGFIPQTITPDAFMFEGESWGRCLMKAFRQPDVLPVDERIRLRKYDGKYALAYEWYQDSETVKLVDGNEIPYSLNRLEKMYDYLNKHGELYFIEVLEEGNYVSIGDVTFWQDDMPIVIGDKRYRGQGIGRKVVQALVERGRSIGFEKLYVNEIYDYNIASIKCFEHTGFQAFEKTENGNRYVLQLK